MGHLDHKATSPATVRCYVLTISDTRQPSNDTSGRAIAELLETNGHQVAGRSIVKDDPDAIRSTLQKQLDESSAQVIITTGGTGITSRDSTYEVVCNLLDKRLEGFGELFRMLSYEEIGASAMMSRACAGHGPGEDHRLAARIRKRRSPRHEQTDPPRARPSRPRAVPLMSSTRMRPFGDVISLDAARAILDRTGAPIDRVEKVPLTEANGRVLARDVIAGGDVPPFSRAGMDGYAVRARDTAGASRAHPRTVARAGVLYTGQVSSRGVGDGECIEISTGAPMPDGADAVVMVEETDADGDVVQIFAEVQPQQNVGRRGADIKAGQIVVAAGETLNSSRIGAVAAVGVPQVDVYERPRVAILSTGNEIVEPGETLQPGHIYDINRFTVGAVVSENGGVPRAYPPAPDSLDALLAALDILLDNDIIVFSGGSSVGERDLIRDAIAAKGKLLFHGVAVKPGKPTGLGVVAASPCSRCRATRLRACRMPTCCSCRCCGGWRGSDRRSTRRSPCPSRHESCRPPAGISSIQ